MRCGYCKERDVTIEHVRAHVDDYSTTPEYTAAIQAAERADDERAYASKPTCAGMGDQSPMWPASDKQKAYVIGLQKERLLPDDYQVKDASDLDVMERDEVSNLIKLLKSFSRDPQKATSGRKQYMMPEGRYAIHHDEKDEWWFFQVDKPTEGRWEGYTFIKRLIGAPGRYRRINMSPAERQGWLAAIEANPKQAMIDYGLNSGVCGRCSSPLTDPESLSRGMGPKCAAKSGWF